MRKTILLAVIAVGVITMGLGASAQQPPEDGRIAIYRQLLTQSNETVAGFGAQLQAAQKKIADLEAERTKLKADGEKKP